LTKRFAGCIAFGKKETFHQLKLHRDFDSMILVVYNKWVNRYKDYAYEYCNNANKFQTDLSFGLIPIKYYNPIEAHDGDKNYDDYNESIYNNRLLLTTAETPNPKLYGAFNKSNRATPKLLLEIEFLDIASAEMDDIIHATASDTISTWNIKCFLSTI
jgi:hypothetical protein